MPDELMQGHLGRWDAWNGSPAGLPPADKLARLARPLGSPRVGPTSSLLAEMAELRHMQYLTAHTCISVVYPFVNKTDGDPWSEWQLRSRCWVTPRHSTYLCFSCIEEDLRRWGFSYWRREHQLAGSVCCSRHGCELREVVTSSRFLMSPAMFLQTPSQTSRPRLHQTYRTNPFVQRYVDLCTHLLRAGRAIHSSRLDGLLPWRKRDLTPRGAPELAKGLVSQIIKSCPASFLSECLRLQNQAVDMMFLRKFFSDIFDPRTPLTPSGYVEAAQIAAGILLGLTALYESATDAANALLGTV
jgi:hypothetical protein